jgi:F420-non-reducing hydrogenase iron-sulfur subunit
VKEAKVGKALLVIHCAEGARKALQAIGQNGLRLPQEVKTLELPCSGRVNEVLLMDALQDGVGGVLVVGCRKENCKFLDGNLRAEKKVDRVRKLLAGAGVADRFVAMTFAAPDEGNKLHGAIMSACERLA